MSRRVDSTMSMQSLPVPSRTMRSTWSLRRIGLALTVAGLVLSACGGDDTSSNRETSVEPTSSSDSADSMPSTGASDPCAVAEGSITVYSGRNENLVDDLFGQFTSQTGVRIEARYGDSGELAGQILTEAGSSPADVFFSQDAGALGALSQAELLGPIDTDILDRVDPAFRSSIGDWVGTSARVRVVVYNPDIVPTPPSTIDELLEPIWKGRVGFAPTNASWQSFVTALRVLRGEDAARQWLEDFKANDPVAYEKNAAVRDAVDAGEVALGLVNHYYLFEKIAAEGGEAVRARNQYLAPGDPGGLVNVAGAGILESSDNVEAAMCFVSYLLSDAGQTYFVNQTFEYPLIDGIAQFEGLPALSSLEPPNIDLSDLSSIAQTQELLADVGLLTL